MTQINCLIPVWKRPEITKMCAQQWIRSLYMARKHGININTFYICSDLQDAQVISDLNESTFHISICDNKPLGKKMNFGLLKSFERYSDYTMTMGSDDEIADQAWPVIRSMIDGGNFGFGFNMVTFVDTKTNKEFTAKYEVVCGAGRCLQTDILKDITKHTFYKCLKSCACVINGNSKSFTAGGYYPFNKFDEAEYTSVLDNYFVEIPVSTTIFWPEEINEGLDTSSGLLFEKYNPIIPIDGPYITDYKSDVNIHSYEKIKNMLVR